VHALLAHPDASGNQLLPHLWPAVSLLALGVNGADVHQQGFVADGPVRSCSLVLGLPWQRIGEAGVITVL